MKKHRYPEYINGIKQIQNPIYRLFIQIWYSDWFRMLFILAAWWLIAVCVAIFIKVSLSTVVICVISILLYLILLVLAIKFNNYSNLRRIGLDEKHNKLELGEKKL